MAESHKELLESWALLGVFDLFLNWLELGVVCQGKLVFSWIKVKSTDCFSLLSCQIEKDCFRGLTFEDFIVLFRSEANVLFISRFLLRFGICWVHILINNYRFNSDTTYRLFILLRDILWRFSQSHICYIQEFNVYTINSLISSHSPPRRLERPIATCIYASIIGVWLLLENITWRCFTNKLL